ncbi:hypothetical protein BKG92_08190 [Rodentibacter ratti]|uniref:Uncharacterized protein n=1 Tax=Rodentibacter ratti TaxID=1906745 RepID=A0A1V3KW37_9PAST|nr:hypothetical protein [Rodentibacter ratti]OOF81897.1 hypothetical protein BKG92_08190 [Rodentibacter ratti]
MEEKTIEAHAADLLLATNLFLNHSVQCLVKQGAIQPSERNALMREYSRLMAEQTRESDRTSSETQAHSVIFSY